MPYIRSDSIPDLAPGRQARNVTYRHDDGGNWVGEVDELLEGDEEITAQQYEATRQATAAHNAAIPTPEPPAVEVPAEVARAREILAKPAADVTDDDLRSLTLALARSRFAADEKA